MRSKFRVTADLFHPVADGRELLDVDRRLSGEAGAEFPGRLVGAHSGKRAGTCARPGIVAQELIPDPCFLRVFFARRAERAKLHAAYS